MNTTTKRRSDCFLYDPRTNVSTLMSLSELKQLTGKSGEYIATTKTRRGKLRDIGCYILPQDVTAKERHALYAKETFPDEAWKVIEGSENFKVSNYGRFIRIYKKGDKVLLPFLRKNNGSMYVKVKFNGIYGQYKVSHLVAHHFIGKREKGKVVRHKNGIKTDDFSGNLEYIGRQKLGKMTGYSSKSKPVVQLGKTGEVINEFRSAREAGRQCFVSYQTVLDYCHGLRKRETELFFMFESDYERG